MAGLSVTMVSIPLNLAISLGSGVPPEIGILTGVVAGATAAIFGGSRLAITGPAAAMSMVRRSEPNKGTREGHRTDP